MGGAGAGLVWGGNHIKIPCYIRHLYGESIDVCLISSVRVLTLIIFSGTNFLAYNYLFPLNLFP